jgi:myosin-18
VCLKLITLKNFFLNLRIIKEFINRFIVSSNIFNSLLYKIKPLYNEAVKKLETTETEMLELRLYNTKKSIEQELEKDDIDGLSSPLAANSPVNHKTVSNSSDGTKRASQTELEKLKRENEQLKKQLREEKEQSKQFNANERGFFEQKLKERDAEFCEMEKQSALAKRKYQKLSEEMQDMQRMLDENKVRNRELEKTQARFDSEMNSLKAKLESEKEMREKSERERDQAKYEVFTLKSELETQKLETVYQSEKVDRLEKDLKGKKILFILKPNTRTIFKMTFFCKIEYESAVGANGAATVNTAPAQLLKMKSQIRDLEAKMKDQEEELDEQSGTIQQLEQTKLRLEMQLEKEKQKWQREIAEKESEMDDLRFHTQKKIKAIEMQLEEEGELSNNLQREKRELERKLREIALNANTRQFSMAHSELNANGLDYLKKLKRQMLKYKTLAVDAQTQLEKLKEYMPKQSIMKSLKSQLEDSEIAKANALKSKHLLQVEVENLQQQLYESNMHKQNVRII